MTVELAVHSAEAIGSVLAMLVALLVYREAKKIRRSEWLLRQNEAWNHLGNTVALLPQASAAAKLLVDDKGGERPTDPKDAFLLMSFFNVVSSEYHAYLAKAIQPRYVIHSLTMTTRVILNNKNWIFHFLRDNGYEHSFIRMLAIVAVVGHDTDKRHTCLTKELKAISRLGAMCGPYRRWLRSVYDEAEVDRLCECASG